jgi:hypothetical protein
VSVTSFFFKVEVEHDSSEQAERLGEEIRRHLQRLYGVRQAELTNYTKTDE